MKVCSFCGKSQDKVQRIITTTKADICNECVLLCMDILIKEQAEYKEVEFPTKENRKKDTYEPMCPYGNDNCIHDCNYIKHHYPDWYEKLGSPTECGDCIDGSRFDDEDK